MRFLLIGRAQSLMKLLRVRLGFARELRYPQHAGIEEGESHKKKTVRLAGLKRRRGVAEFQLVTYRLPERNEDQRVPIPLPS